MKRLVITILAALWAFPVSAQMARNCGPRDIVLDRLAQGFGEVRKSIGIGGNDTLVELFASDETGTWSITVSHPNGITCLVASGRAYEAVSEVLPKEESAL